MFCQNCGKELPDGAKFCAFCGTVISIEPQQTQKQKPSDVSTPDQSNDNTAQDSNNDEGKVQQQKSAILQKKKSIVIIGIAIALVVAVVVGIFSVRAYNERDMIRQIPWAVYNDETSDTITAFYEDYLGKSLMTGCDAEDFSVEQGSDSNTFDFVGKIEVTDLSQDSRPTYYVNVTGTIKANFFRTKYSLTYKLQYQVPADANVVTMQTLYQAYSTNAASANRTYANQYLNVSGTITQIRSDTYSNTVVVELGLPSELFYANFEFKAANSDVYDLRVGDTTTLTGYLAQSGTYIITFTDASIYKRNTSGNGSKPAGTTNDFPPTLPPIDPNDPDAYLYSDHMGRYINEDGLVLEIGVVTSWSEPYYAKIYADRSDADNYANPLLTLEYGSLDYRNGYMIIYFVDSLGNYITFERDNMIADNYTLDMGGDPTFAGISMESYYDYTDYGSCRPSTFYMFERYIEIMS